MLYTKHTLAFLTLVLGSACDAGDRSVRDEASGGTSGNGGFGGLAGEVNASCECGSTAYPFGSHVRPYASGSILPNHLSQGELDGRTLAFYETWKSRYVKAACGDGRAYVQAGIDANNLTISEAHGYGMLISVLMGGRDPDAQPQFDAMFRFFKDHPSRTTTDLMGWYQNKQCENDSGGSSATDGDLDIAFALLLADRQWGRCSEIDYKAEALRVIAAIESREVDSTFSYVLLGDWVSSGGRHYAGTRSSDFMPDHFASFAASGGNVAWTGMVDKMFGVIDALQGSHSPGTGLVPDFIVNPTESPAPPAGQFLESDNDGAYAYNACRFPFRLASYFVTSGDPRAAAVLGKLNSFIKTSTSGKPGNIRPGYQLSGTPLGTYVDLAFIAPLATGAMVDAGNQEWLNAAWNTVAGAGNQDYYQETLKLLSMILMSGNWWVPEWVDCQG